MATPRLNIVLYQPEIPNNTGNIGRTAAAAGCRLHLIHPLSFDMSEKARRRAGLDYWQHVDCVEHQSWHEFLDTEHPRRLWLYTTRSARPHWHARFEPGDYLLFGRETSGVPAEIHAWVSRQYGEEARVTLPMNPNARSLNLATVVCTAVYEGLRQLDAGEQCPLPAIGEADMLAMY